MSVSHKRFPSKLTGVLEAEPACPAVLTALCQDECQATSRANVWGCPEIAIMDPILSTQEVRPGPKASKASRQARKMEHQRFLVKVANIMLLSSNKETRVSHAFSYEAFFAFTS